MKPVSAATLLVLALALAPQAAPARPSEPHRIALLRALDKVTARVTTLAAPVDRPTRFGTLVVTPRACLVAPPIEPPERAAFLEIRDESPRGGDGLLFSGWMFASSPGLSALEHPIYDLWLLDCREPEAGSPPGPTSPSAKP